MLFPEMTELGARDPKIQALFPVSLGAHGLVPKTELFKTNYRDFHCWTRVTGGKENHRKTKTSRKIHKTTVFRHWATGNTIQ